MTISESLLSVNSYPIPTNHIEVICLDRGLGSTEEYTADIGITEEYDLAKADVYFWLFTAPGLREQEVAFTLQDRDNFLSIANAIYYKYGDEKYSGTTYGFTGEDFNT